jgi:hypothetical protein
MLVPIMFRLGMLLPIMFQLGMLVPNIPMRYACAYSVPVGYAGVSNVPVRYTCANRVPRSKLKAILPCMFVVSVSTYTLASKRVPSLQGEHEYRMSCICA